MGFAKSMRKANYLRPVADAIKNYIREKERVDYLNKLGEGFGDAYRRNQGMIEYGVDPGDSTFTDVPQQTEAGGQESAQFTGKPTTPNIPIEGVQDEVLGDFLNVPERRSRVQNSKMDFLMNALQDPNADMKRIGLMGNMLGQQGQGIKYDADFEGMLKDMESGDYGDKARGFVRNFTEAIEGGASGDDLKKFAELGKQNLSTYKPKKKGKKLISSEKTKYGRLNKYGTDKENIEKEEFVRTNYDTKGSGSERADKEKNYKISKNVSEKIAEIKNPNLGRIDKERYLKKGYYADEDIRKLKIANDRDVSMEINTAKGHSWLEETKKKKGRDYNKLHKAYRDAYVSGELSEADARSMLNYFVTYKTYYENFLD